MVVVDCLAITECEAELGLSSKHSAECELLCVWLLLQESLKLVRAQA